jgi:hypothetical protein
MEVFRILGHVVLLKVPSFEHDLIIASLGSVAYKTEVLARLADFISHIDIISQSHYVGFQVIVLNRLSTLGWRTRKATRVSNYNVFSSRV